MKQYFKIDFLIFGAITFANLFSYIFLPNLFYNLVNNWPFNEWLINYRGGFVKRGISGEIFFWLNKINMDHIIIIFLISFLSIAHILINVFKILKNSNFSYRIFILFNPFGLIFLIQNLELLFGRGDFLYINFILYLLNKEKINKTIFIIFSLLLILKYEIYILLIFLIYNIVVSKKLINKRVFNYLSIFLFLPLNILTLLIFRTVKDFNKLCSSINEINKNIDLLEKNCWGAPHWLNKLSDPLNAGLNEVIYGVKLYNNPFEWIALFLFFLLALFILLDFKYKLLLNYIFLLFPYLILFRTQDWGRWIFFIFFIIFFHQSLIDKGSLDLLKNNNFSYLRNFLLILFTLSNIVINLPTHLYQDISIFDIRSLDIIYYEFLSYLKNIYDYILKIIYEYL